MKGSWLSISLLWGLAFGTLEAAFSTRVNHVYPVGTGHVLLVLVFTLGFTVIACVAGGLAAVMSRQQRSGTSTNGGSVLPLLAGPWLLSLILAVSLYRDRINDHPNTTGGLVMTIVVVVVMIVLLAVFTRWLRGQHHGLQRVLLGLGTLLFLGTGVCLFTARAVPPPSKSESTVTVEQVGGVQDTGLRVLLVGLDGGTWQVMDRLLAEGRLPAHAAVMARGLSADLKVPLPSYSPPLWTSIASSRTADEHGIHDHIRTAPPFGLPTAPFQVKHFDHLTKVTKLATRRIDKYFPFRPVFALNQDVFVRRLWDILDPYGYPSLVVDWYVTYPAQPGLGIMVSDHLHLHKDDALEMPGLVYPESLTARFARHIHDPEDIPEDHLFSFLDAADLNAAGRTALRKVHPEWFSVISKEMARDLTALDVCREALPLLPEWRFGGVYFRAMDNIHHMTWHLQDLAGEDLDQYPKRRFRTAVDLYYDYCDSLLAGMMELVDLADEQTVVIVMSDHGWENTRYGHSRAPDGFFIMAGGPTIVSGERQEIHIYD
ncbi:MAG: alkaline phosphatase family protein, partial [bacterium]